MNALRPKSKLYKRNNKAKARVRKEVLLKALADAVKAAATEHASAHAKDAANVKAA